jgi:lipopolysaccharide export system protein LptA
VEASGQRFWIEFFPQTADPFRFRLDGDVKARRTVAERWSETSSDTLTGEFSPSDHRQLSGLVQQGDVRFRDAERQGRAREARLEGDLLHLTGKPVVESAGVVTRAAEMTYNQRTSALQGAGGVETVIVPGSAPGQKAVLPMGDAESAGQKVYIHADTVELDQTTNQVTFRGGCRMVQARNVLTAGRFVWNRQDETFSAEDKVLLVATVREKTGPERRLEIRSGRLAYNPLRRRILFEREVRTLSADGEMASDALWGYFEEGQGLRKLFAQGQIRITQKSREATGDRAMVDLAQNRFVLQGSPARVVDRAEGRTTQGVQLTFFQGDDTIRVDSKAQPIDME